MNQQRPTAIAKVLSGNDVGATGAHQAGMYVPKDIIDFFPHLDPTVRNPRTTMRVTADDGTPWEFEFIFYNNRRWGGTRNEYRLTCMTAYINACSLHAGDQVILLLDGEGSYRIQHQKTATQPDNNQILRLGHSWKVITYKGGSQ